MPDSSLLNIAVWLLAIAGEIYLAMIFIRRGVFRRWPSLISYLLYQFALDAGLFVLFFSRMDEDRKAFIYFYAYWFGQIGVALFQVWILWQVVVALIGFTKTIRKWSAVAFSAVVLISVSVAIWASEFLHSPFYLTITRDVLDAQRILSLAWCLAFIAVAFSAALAGLYWRREVLTVAFGFALLAASETLCSWIISALGPHAWTPSFAIENILYLFTLASWATAFTNKAQETNVNISPERLKAALLQLEMSLHIGAEGQNK